MIIHTNPYFFRQNGGFLSHRGTPSHHPFLGGMFPNKNPRAIWVPLWPWKPPFMDFEKETDHLGNRCLNLFTKNRVFAPRLQDCMSVIAKSHKPVTVKSQVCDCRVTRLWLQNQETWCHCNKVNYYSTRMIVVCVCVEQTELYGGILVRGLSGAKLCVRLRLGKGVAFKACDWMWQTKKESSPWRLINWGSDFAECSSGGSNPF